MPSPPRAVRLSAFCAAAGLALLAAPPRWEGPELVRLTHSHAPAALDVVALLVLASGSAAFVIAGRRRAPALLAAVGQQGVAGWMVLALGLGVLGFVGVGTRWLVVPAAALLWTGFEAWWGVAAELSFKIVDDRVEQSG